ncbi:hypothetical protein FPOAC2_12007 [Fusarium poae]|uniref:hypothetical protein n=1 Tax=Fusarium poae TaxID=36050 RepID=UPI001CE82120|nr:hypothetical protein FPOAC1_011694 [Fusarium poae]KAG8666872.1 hypothetical protein FPOAC1_011694 [Fusarium poae]
MTIDRKACRPVVRIRDVGIGPEEEENASGGWAKYQEDYLFNVSDTEQQFLAMVNEMASDLGVSRLRIQSFQKSLLALRKLFIETQAISLEVDLLHHDDGQSGKIICANSRFMFDDDAPKKARKIYTPLWEPLLEDASELYAKTFGLVYVRMDGDIGTVVNGAGLAMATNDAISFHNGKSANFLDAGGQATKDTMIKAFKVVMDDRRVKTILVNIYGGITKCDMIAESIIAAVNQFNQHRKMPIVVRLQGTNAEEGLKLLEDANLGIHVEGDFDKAAKKAVELADSNPIPPNADIPNAITRVTLKQEGKIHRIEMRKKKKREMKKAEKARMKQLQMIKSGGDK